MYYDITIKCDCGIKLKTQADRYGHYRIECYGCGTIYGFVVPEPEGIKKL